MKAKEQGGTPPTTILSKLAWQPAPHIQFESPVAANVATKSFSRFLDSRFSRTDFILVPTQVANTGMGVAMTPIAPTSSETDNALLSRSCNSPVERHGGRRSLSILYVRTKRYVRAYLYIVQSSTGTLTPQQWHRSRKNVNKPAECNQIDRCHRCTHIHTANELARSRLEAVMHACMPYILLL